MNTAKSKILAHINKNTQHTLIFRWAWSMSYTVHMLNIFMFGLVTSWRARTQDSLLCPTLWAVRSGPLPQSKQVKLHRRVQEVDAYCSWRSGPSQFTSKNRLKCVLKTPMDVHLLRAGWVLGLKSLQCIHCNKTWAHVWSCYFLKGTHTRFSFVPDSMSCAKWSIATIEAGEVASSGPRSRCVLQLKEWTKPVHQ